MYDCISEIDRRVQGPADAHAVRMNVPTTAPPAVRMDVPTSGTCLPASTHSAVISPRNRIAVELNARPHALTKPHGAQVPAIHTPHASAPLPPCPPAHLAFFHLLTAIICMALKLFNNAFLRRCYGGRQALGPTV